MNGVENTVLPIKRFDKKKLGNIHFFYNYILIRRGARFENF